MGVAGKGNTAFSLILPWRVTCPLTNLPLQISGTERTTRHSQRYLMLTLKPLSYLWYLKFLLSEIAQLRS